MTPQVHFGTIASGSKITAEDLENTEKKWTEQELNPVLAYQEYPFLEEKIKKGEKLHAFLSGGGLRVCHLDNKAYGEHPYIEIALKLAEEDCQAGGRDYNEVYGKIVPHFYTGSSTPSSPLDRWVRTGRSFDINHDKTFIFTSEYYYQHRTPQDVCDKVINAYKKLLEAEKIKDSAKIKQLKNQMCVTYTDDDILYEVTPFIFPSGEVGTTCRAIKVPKGKNTWGNMKKVRYEGGNTLLEHLNFVNTMLEKEHGEQDS